MSATLGTWDVLWRLGAATLLGALVGVERQWRGQVAGLRTHALVAAGSALFTLAGAYGFSEIPRSTNVDPMRVAAQVASGIGFIGAGAIIRHGVSVRGVTTAATLWGSAALGLAAAAGLVMPAAVGAALVLATLVGFAQLRRALVRALHRRGRPALPEELIVRLTYERGHGTLAEVLEELSAAGCSLRRVQISDDGDRRERGLRHVELVVAARDPDDVRRALQGLERLDEICRVSIDSALRAATQEEGAAPYAAGAGA